MLFDMHVFDAFLAMACALLAAAPLGAEHPYSSPAHPQRPDAHARTCEAARGSGSGEGGLVAYVMRTRVVKALWELLQLPPIRALASSKYPRLIHTLLSISEAAICRVPLTYLSTSSQVCVYVCVYVL